MGRTRASDFGVKQRSILDSAAAVFAELGMDKASMAQIARHGNVSKALLYHYYPSKDALIFDIVRTHLEELDAAIAAADRPDLPPAQRLRLLVHQVIASYEGADNEHKVQLNSAGTLSPEQAAELRALERQIVRRFAEVIRQLNPDLERDRPLLIPVTMSLFGMLNWVYMWSRPDGPLTRQDYADLATTLMLDGVMGVR